jgi:hypothetical protein
MKDERQQTSELSVDEALRHFRASVIEWSERELRSVDGARTVPNRQRSRWQMWSTAWSPAVGWAMAAVLVFAGVGVPVGIHHRDQIQAERQAAELREQQKQRDAAVEARQQALAKIDDDELLNHVDSDIAQETPDAMAPLASLMSESAAR